LRSASPLGQDAIHVEKEGLDGVAIICPFLGRRLSLPAASLSATERVFRSLEHSFAQ